MNKIFILTGIGFLGIFFGSKFQNYAPKLHESKAYIVYVKPTPTPTPNVDYLIDKYSKKYGKTTYTQNRIKVLIHFSMIKESNYGNSNKCGDHGKACGPLQFHEPTYEGYRKIMMKQNLVTEMGTRMDMEDAIETMAWAVADGREGAWGPIARGEIKL